MLALPPIIKLSYYKIRGVLDLKVCKQRPTLTLHLLTRSVNYCTPLSCPVFTSKRTVSNSCLIALCPGILSPASFVSHNIFRSFSICLYEHHLPYESLFTLLPLISPRKFIYLDIIFLRMFIPCFKWFDVNFG